jgi:hypothetical protein
VAFESGLGLSVEHPWEWINSYFYPDKEEKGTQAHIYSNYPATEYTVVGYKPKPKTVP